MQHAVIRDGVVENIVEWDGKSPWASPDGTTVAPAPGAVGVGWTYAGGRFADPSPPPPPKVLPVLTLEEKLQRAGLSIDDIKAAVAHQEE